MIIGVTLSFEILFVKFYYKFMVTIFGIISRLVGSGRHTFTTSTWTLLSTRLIM